MCVLPVKGAVADLRPFRPPTITCEGPHLQRLPCAEAGQFIGRCFTRAIADHQALEMLERPSASHRPVGSTVSRKRPPTLLSYLCPNFGRVTGFDQFTMASCPTETAWLSYVPFHYTTQDIRRYHIRRRSPMLPQFKRSLVSVPARWVRHASAACKRCGRERWASRYHQSLCSSHLS